MNEIFFKSLENGEGLYQINKDTKGSAGFDLIAAIKNEISIDPGSTKLIPCGFLFKCQTALKDKSDQGLV